MVFYFSATGNTRWAVEQLADALDEHVAFIPEQPDGLVSVNLQDGERLGFCFPVHGWRPPKNVREFVSRLRIQAEGHFTYAICTAGDTLGETINIFEKDLARVGIRLDSAYSLILPESYVGLPFMDVDKPENEKRKKEQAEVELKTYIQDIAVRKAGIRKLAVGPLPRLHSRLFGSVFVNCLVTDKHFRVDHQRCVKCGICADVCPVGDITGGLGYEPEWKHNGACLTCFACYHHCPHHAIEFGNQTKHKGQYFYKHKIR